MKVKNIGIFAVVILFRCFALMLVGVGLFSVAETLFALPTQSLQFFGAAIIKIVFLYVVSALILWFLSKPIAEFIVSDLEIDSSDKNNDLLRSSLLS